jgi:hypothetical protein
MISIIQLLELAILVTLAVIVVFLRRRLWSKAVFLLFFLLILIVSFVEIVRSWDTAMRRINKNFGGMHSTTTSSTETSQP